VTSGLASRERVHGGRVLGGPGFGFFLIDRCEVIASVGR
jgi:hypothetical protein